MGVHNKQVKNDGPSRRKHIICAPFTDDTKLGRKAPLRCVAVGYRVEAKVFQTVSTAASCRTDRTA